MKKRKVMLSSDSKNVQTKIKNKNTHGTEIEVDIDSNVSPKYNPVSKGKKDLKVLADIGHKNTSGSNNWQTFLNLTKHKTNDSSELNHKTASRPYQHNDLKSVNSVVSPIDKSLKRKIEKPNRPNLTRTRSNSNDKPMQYRYDNEVMSMSNVKSDKRNAQSNKHTVLTKQIAMDCEMVGVEVGVDNSILARISLVNAHGDCIYDKYVKPTEPILDYRTRVSGIRPKDLENASDFKTVQKEVADIITSRILVGHALKNDLKVLFLSHPKHDIRDTSKFKRFRAGRIPSLKSLANKYLGVTIQEGEHSSVQDALAAMQLYKMFKNEWEASIHTKRLRPTDKKAKTICSTSLVTSTVNS